MSLFQQVRRTIKEAVLVTTADISDELGEIRNLQDQLSAAGRSITARQTAYRDKLAGYLHAHYCRFLPPGCLGGAAVQRRTHDRKVAGLTPTRGAIKSTRSTQPSIPLG